MVLDLREFRLGNTGKRILKVPMEGAEEEVRWTEKREK